MSGVIDTLFAPLEEGLTYPAGPVLFLGARDHPALSQFEDLHLFQDFAPYAQGLNIFQGDCPEHVALALVLIPQNLLAARGMIARALKALREDGVLLCAAENKAGGSRLKKLFSEFGLHDVESLSKHKARAVWAVKGEVDQDALEKAIQASEVQKPAHGFYTRPGVFGWDKIDVGSALLVEYLPDDLKGAGADFGCGYGYLARAVLETNPKIKALYALDADRRAVECCAKNLEGVVAKTDFIWTDLAIQPDLPPLDWVVMNPPFHEGKNTSADLGQAFIRNAAGCLKRYGQLFMVANAHLPYEAVLKDHFHIIEKLSEQRGFKVFRAVK